MRRVTTLCDTVKTCYEATYGEEVLLETHVLRVKTQAFFSTTLCWLWGKSPDQRQRVPVVKKRVFLESYSEEASAQSWTREGRFVKAK